ncbi:MAG TPA: PilZ domain-containing protein, partial [Pseudomonadales bacterium]|nr:PilZ domain-containing protein [Pseudomonadales bacterium]
MDQPPTRLAGEIFHHTDRRRVSRIRCYAPVLVESTAGCYPAALADLSLQGALLQVPQWQPAVNECATLLVELDTQGIQLILEARVRHQHDARIGVQFTEVNDLQQRCLR